MYGYPPPPGAPAPNQANQASQPQGQAQGQAGQPAAPAVHICFSGLLSCSGCFPCDACAQIVKANVLVTALMEEQRVLAMDLQAALQQGRPINLQLLAETFFKTVALSWRQLHEAMKAEPPEQRPFRIANVSAILEAAEAYRAMMIERQQAAQAAQAAASPTPPIAAQPAPPQPSPPRASSAGPSSSNVVPSTPVDFSKAMETREDPPGVITVSAEEAPGPGAPPPASPPAKRITAEDFARAAPPAEGRSNGEIKNKTS